MSRCIEDLGSIHEAKAALKPRKQGDPPPANSVAGMEIALTIAGMISSHIDPGADLDDQCYRQNTRDNFAQLLTALAQHKMPPTVAFVTANEVDRDFGKEWLEAGNLFGNSTFSRLKLKKVGVQQFVDDIAKCDEFLSSLRGRASKPARYFRYPGANRLGDRDKRAEISSYLNKHDYREAPVTIEAQDDLLSQVYCAALARGDQSCANLVKVVFRSTLLGNAAAARSVSNEIAGHEIRHILALNANQLVCDTLGEMIDMCKGEGIRFIALDAALADPFYAGEEKWVFARKIRQHARRHLRLAEDK